MENNHDEKFPGFPGEPNTNYWPYPRALNGWWHALTGSEQKALDYLLRHTWGYKKASDRISYSQFMHGIKRKKDGVWVDKGCGIKSSRTLANALKGLGEKGFVKVEKSTRRANLYTLKITDDPVETKEPLYKVKSPPLENKVVGTLESKETTTDVTIKDPQQVSCWVNKYGDGVNRLIERYGSRQVQDAIRYTEGRDDVQKPIAFITALCKKDFKWEETEGAREERRLEKLREDTEKLYL